VVRRWWPRVSAGVVLAAVLVVGGTGFRVWQVARTDDRSLADIVQSVAPMVVTVGGRRAGDAHTEAEAGRRYLMQKGLPSSAVVAVETGGDTLSSLQAVAAAAREHGWRSAVIVSDPWHSLRARTMARDAGLTARTSPTRSGPVVQTRQTQARYILRETAAMLYYRLTHAPAETPSTGLG
jgi:uncharacterized SAM-binding protein YcdF (DUF218 family)